MAPIKFEEQIKDKLEQRKVTLSVEAWSKLSQRLDADEKRSKKSSFWWLGIAASVAAIVFVSVSYFNKNGENTVNEIIVKENIKDVISPKTDAIITSPENTNTETQIVVAEKNSDIEVGKESVNKKEELKSSAIVKTNSTQSQILNTAVDKQKRLTVATVDKQQEKQSINKELSNSVKDALTPKETTEFNSVVAELQKIKTENKTRVTDRQIDSLLKVASRELLLDRALNKNSNTVVDADALLQYAEDDLGQSFRTRIYEALKNGFNDVKTVVAKRNN